MIYIMYNQSYLYYECNSIDVPNGDDITWSRNHDSIFFFFFFFHNTLLFDSPVNKTP